MKSSKASLGRSTEQIVARIEKVRRASDKAARSTERFTDYRYLRSVLRAYQYFQSTGLLSHLIEIAPGVLRILVRADWHPLRIIIEATSNKKDARMRSRWTRALQFAAFQQVDGNEVTAFIRANGGVAGCADLASKVKLKGSGARLAGNRGRR